MAVDGVIKEKKKKKRIKKEEEVENAQDGETTDMTQYHNASVQTTVKAERSEVSICEGEQHEYEVPEKKKKKKIKEEKVDPNIHVTLCCDASAQTAVKTEQLEIKSEGGQEKSDVPQKEKKKKKKKRTKEESEHLQEEVMDISISEAGEKMDKDCLEVSRIKKVKKKRVKQMEGNVTEAVKKKKKKKKIEAVVKEEEVDVGHNGEIKKKKKKKRKKGYIEDEQTPELDNGEIKKKRKKMTDTNVKTDVCREDEQTEKKKKKKEKVTNLKTKHDVECVKEEEKVKIKKKKSALLETEVDEVNVNTEAKKKSKKLKKRIECLEEAPPHVNRTKGKTTCDVIAGVRSSDQKMKKNMKVEFDNVMEVMEEPVEKKWSKKDMSQFLEKTDVVFLSEKPGNQDEVSIDQARRLALQKEIDKESQPKSSLGQWGTAQFDSSDRQAKFLRLMGGFKKGSQPITGSSGCANMALGKEGQQTLQQGLLGEFERAQSRHMDFRSKGTGLGFTAPSNKKFAIDVNVRNSIRFDD